MTASDLPLLNACLNGAATLCLTAGFLFIKAGRREAHRACMLAAVALSALFLAGYVTYHLQTGARTPFGGQGAIRTFYYAMLLSHVVLAIAVPPLVLTTLWHALRGRFEVHRRWARVTYPIWYYVSITGVLVYLFLYQWWPARPA